MGYSNSWIAVKGLDQATAVRELGKEVGGPVALLHLPKFGVATWGEWLLVLAPGDKALKEPIVRLASRGPAVACYLEDHVMYSEARGYEGGAERWRVVRDAEDGTDDVTTSGELPAAFEGIRADALRKHEAEEDVDYVFEIPLRLAESVSGFRLDELEADDFVWTELRPPAKPGLLQRLFGRG